MPLQLNVTQDNFKKLTSVFHQLITVSENAPKYTVAACDAIKSELMALRLIINSVYGANSTPSASASNYERFMRIRKYYDTTQVYKDKNCALSIRISMDPEDEIKQHITMRFSIESAEMQRLANDDDLSEHGRLLIPIPNAILKNNDIYHEIPATIYLSKTQLKALCENKMLLKELMLANNNTDTPLIINSFGATEAEKYVKIYRIFKKIGVFNSQKKTHY